MKPRPIIIALVFTAIILFLMFTAFFFKQAVHSAPLPILGEVTDFNLTDSRGEQVTLARLTGKIWVTDFIFTTCAGICPIMTKHMAALHRSYQLLDDVAMVSISVNPETDTPTVMAEYAKKQNAKTDRWYFLSGSRKEIQELAVKSFKIGSVDEPIFHSTYFVLVDREGRIRGYYEGTEAEDIEKLFKDIAILLKEK